MDDSTPVKQRDAASSAAEGAPRGVVLHGVDEAVLAAARNGNGVALDALIRTLQDPWYRMSLSLLGDADLARDATQETALRFLRQLPGFRGESQLRTWSLGIALNVAREMRRASSRAVSWVDTGDVEAAAGGAAGRQAGGQAGTASGGGPVSEAIIAEQREDVRQSLAGLPDRQREALVLRFFEELSVEQTAAAMGCAAGTVKATVHQALRSIRKRLKLTPDV